MCANWKSDTKWMTINTCVKLLCGLFIVDILDMDSVFKYIYVFVRLCVQCFPIRCSCAVHLTPWRLSLFSIRHLYERITEIATSNVYWTGKRHHNSDEKISQNLIVISFPDTYTHTHSTHKHIVLSTSIYVAVSFHRMQFSIRKY